MNSKIDTYFFYRSCCC